MGDIFIAEGNNELNIRLKPIPLDLTDFVIEPAEVRVGEPVHISFKVTNMTKARSGIDAYCTVDKTELEPQSTGWLYLGESAVLAWNFTPTEAKTYDVVVDVREMEIPMPPRVRAFVGMFTALPTGDATPVGISIPSTIVAGSEFWASHTVYLPYIPNCRYRISLALVGTGLTWGKEVTAAEARFVDHNWMLPEYFPLAHPISGDGQFTFTGRPQADYDRETDTHGPVYQIPAKATYWKDHILEYPLPKGVYNVLSWGKFYIIKAADENHTEYEDYWWLWKELRMGEVEIV